MIRRKRQRLIDAIKVESNLFSKITNKPWLSESEPTGLNIDLMASYGFMYTSPVIQMISQGEEMSSSQLEMLGRMIGERYGERWSRLYEVLAAQYNPLENYDRMEQSTNQKDNTGTQGTSTTDNTTEIKNSGVTETDTRAVTTTDTQKTKDKRTETKTSGTTETDGRTVTTTDTQKTKDTTNDTLEKTGKEIVTSTHSVSAYDSSALSVESQDETTTEYPSTPDSSVMTESKDATVTHEVLSGNVEEAHSGTVTTKNDGDPDIITDEHEVLSGDVTEQHSGTLVTKNDGTPDTVNRNITEARTDNLKEVNQTNSHIHGNIGVTTSQQMLESEIDLRNRWDFWGDVLRDIGEYCTLNVMEV